ncbi:MAG: hypothetical protein ACRDSL_04295 [Pseudonocardiaceae bacterium]
MSEPVDASSALFGPDGTELPDPLPVLPDPLTGPERGEWRDAPTIPPVPLPAMPDARAMREAILAQLGEDPPAAPSSSTAETRPVPHPGAHPQTAGVGAFPYQRPLPRPVGSATMGGPAAPGSHRPPVSGPPRALSPVPPADLRRRISRELPAGLPTRLAGGVRTGCVITLIIFGVVAFNIIAGFMQSVSALFH